MSEFGAKEGDTGSPGSVAVLIPLASGFKTHKDNHGRRGLLKWSQRVANF
jgi:ribosomal protein S15P/S13E